MPLYYCVITLQRKILLHLRLVLHLALKRPITFTVGIAFRVKDYYIYGWYILQLALNFITLTVSIKFRVLLAFRGDTSRR